MHLFKIGLAIIGALLAMTSHAAPSFDIAGLKLGSPFAEAKAIIQKANPEYKFEEIKYVDGKVAGLRASAQAKRQNSLQIVDEFIVLQNEAGIVWLAGRGQSLDKGQGILKQTLFKSLEEKYGPPSDVGEGDPVWAFDVGGKQFKGNSRYGGPCMEPTYDAARKKLSQRFKGIEVFDKYPPSCGLYMNMRSISFNAGSNGVDHYSVLMVNPQFRHDENALKKAQSEKEKMQQNKELGMQGNKPKL